MTERITYEEYTEWKKEAESDFLTTAATGWSLAEVYERGFLDAIGALEFYGKIQIEKPVKYR